MKKVNFNMVISGIILLLISVVSSVYGIGKAEPESMKPIEESDFAIEGIETAVFAGGCFWGVEAVFELLEGVDDVVSGYAGGSADTAFYRMVGTGTTGHGRNSRDSL